MKKTKKPEYSPEGYPTGSKALAKLAKKRLDEQAEAAKRGEALLKKMQNQLQELSLTSDDESDSLCVCCSAPCYGFPCLDCGNVIVCHDCHDAKNAGYFFINRCWKYGWVKDAKILTLPYPFKKWVESKK